MAARSRCSLGKMRLPPRGIVPAGIVKTRSPGMMRGVWVMLSFQRSTTTEASSPPTPATINNTSMKTYFTPAPPRRRRPGGWP